MKLLIIGASRGVGREAVKEALARGYEVRAFARSADSISISDPKLEMLNGDALNTSDLDEAMIGVDAVILTLGIRAGPAMVVKPVRLFSEATRRVVDSMKKAGVKRLICVTGFGAGDSRARLDCIHGALFELILGRAYQDKDAQEIMIRQSGLDWVIARPVILTNGSKTGRYKVLTDPETWRNGVISRADVADFLIGQAGQGGLLRKTPVLRY